MIDLQSLRRNIEAAPAEGEAYLPVTRKELEQLHRELVAGNAARAELAMHKGMAAVIDTIQSGARR